MAKKKQKSDQEKARSYDELRAFVLKRSALKRDVFELSKVEFAKLKQQLEAMVDKLHEEVHKVDPRLEVRFQDRNDFECAVVIAGDYLLFHLHTNIFRLDEEEASGANKTYLKQNTDRAYCATILVYNFLADSFRFERPNDAGYLAARIFINFEKHIAAEGINLIGSRYAAFSKEPLSENSLGELLQTIIYEALNFELLAPEYGSIAELRLTDAIRTSGLSGQRTSKRLGFRFSSDTEEGPF